MNEETLTKLQEIFTPVAQKIGEGAQFGWEVVVMQQYVYAWLGVFWAVIGIAGLVATFHFIRFACAHKLKNGHLGSEAEYWGTFGAIFLGVPSLVSFIGGIHTAITHFLNPHYYAIEFFINLVK